MPSRIASIIGARPQFIKAAVVSRHLSERDDIEELIIHTGQHFDETMSAVFFAELAIPAPAHNLGIQGGGHGEMTGRMMERLEPVLIAERPDAVVVYGDTNSTIAGALTAAKLHIPVVHVEAGLRSFNRRMPEEINRILADHLSSLLFCPTREAIRNLKREGITKGVHVVGDVMYDATLFAREKGLKTSTLLEKLHLRPGEYALCTLHRSENTDDARRFHEILAFLRAEADRRPVVFPAHPRTRQTLIRNQVRTDGLIVIEPVGYFDMHRLLAGAALVLTDSGGLQKEAYFHRVPCVTLRAETEWIETIEAGWNRLWTVPDYKPRREIPDYGDGRAGRRTADIMSRFLAYGPE
jgi:UDP-GlcNAc3NAcA epimerase